jgi:hypothetical protein
LILFAIKMYMETGQLIYRSWCVGLAGSMLVAMNSNIRIKWKVVKQSQFTNVAGTVSL